MKLAKNKLNKPIFNSCFNQLSSRTTVVRKWSRRRRRCRYKYPDKRSQIRNHAANTARSGQPRSCSPSSINPVIKRTPTPVMAMARRSNRGWRLPHGAGLEFDLPQFPSISGLADLLIVGNSLSVVSGWPVIGLLLRRRGLLQHGDKKNASERWCCLYVGIQFSLGVWEKAGKWG